MASKGMATEMVNADARNFINPKEAHDIKECLGRELLGLLIVAVTVLISSSIALSLWAPKDDEDENDGSRASGLWWNGFALVATTGFIVLCIPWIIRTFGGAAEDAAAADAA